MNEILLYKLVVREVKPKIRFKEVEQTEIVTKKRFPFNLFKESKGRPSDELLNGKKLVDERESLTYCIHYRIDEDRFWFTKYECDEVVDSHHTKKGFDGSMDIVENIAKRYLDILETINVEIDIAYDIRLDVKNQNVMDAILKNTKEIKKNEGIFLR